MGRYYSEEELKQYKNDINFIIIESGYGKKYMNKLEEKIKDLQDRIDKAINYLKSDNYWVSQVKANDYLLDILKGSGKDEY